MSFTRFYDDPSRIKKQLQQTTFVGRYMLDVPGPGMELPFWEDPQVRMQKWGSNLTDNYVNLESDLFGMTRKINRDLVDINDFKKQSVNTQKLEYKNMKPFVDESRATHPAWMYKTIEQNRWEYPFLNPLNGLEKEFHNNIQTRILEKDYFKSYSGNLRFP
jgi:hypothetical protein